LIRKQHEKNNLISSFVSVLVNVATSDDILDEGIEAKKNEEAMLIYQKMMSHFGVIPVYIRHRSSVVFLRLFAISNIQFYSL